MEIVKLYNAYFHSVVDSTLKRKKKDLWHPSLFAACAKIYALSIVDKLLDMSDYELLFLTDDMIGMHKFGEATWYLFITVTSRKMIREFFRKELVAGVENMYIHFYSKMCEGVTPT